MPDPADLADMSDKALPSSPAVGAPGPGRTLSPGGPQPDGPEAAGACLVFAVGTPLAAMERQAIAATLAQCRGDKRRCAALLGVSLKTLYNRLAAYRDADARAVAP